MEYETNELLIIRQILENNHLDHRGFDLENNFGFGIEADVYNLLVSATKGGEKAINREALTRLRDFSLRSSSYIPAVEGRKTRWKPNEGQGRKK